MQWFKHKHLHAFMDLKTQLEIELQTFEPAPPPEKLYRWKWEALRLSRRKSYADILAAEQRKYIRREARYLYITEKEFIALSRKNRTNSLTAETELRDKMLFWGISNHRRLPARTDPRWQGWWEQVFAAEDIFERRYRLLRDGPYDLERAEDLAISGNQAGKFRQTLDYLSLHERRNTALNNLGPDGQTLERLLEDTNDGTAEGIIEDLEEDLANNARYLRELDQISKVFNVDKKRLFAVKDFNLIYQLALKTDTRRKLGLSLRAHPDEVKERERQEKIRTIGLENTNTFDWDIDLAEREQLRDYLNRRHLLPYNLRRDILLSDETRRWGLPRNTIDRYIDTVLIPKSSSSTEWIDRFGFAEIYKYREAPRAILRRLGIVPPPTVMWNDVLRAMNQPEGTRWPTVLRTLNQRNDHPPFSTRLFDPETISLASA